MVLRARKVLTALAVAIALLVALTLSVPALLHWQLTTRLEALGVASVDIGNLQWGWRQAITDRLHLAGRYQQMPFALTLSDVRLDFPLRTVLQGRLKGASVDRVHLELDGRTWQQGTPRQPARPWPIRTFVAQLGALSLPVENLSVNRLTAVALWGEQEKVTLSGDDMLLRGVDQTVAGTLQLGVDREGARNLELEVVLAPGQAAWIPGVRMTGEESGQPFFEGRVDYLPEPTAAAGQPLAVAVSARFEHGDTMTLLHNLSRLAGKAVESPAELTGPLALGMNLGVTLQVPPNLDFGQAHWLSELVVDGSGAIELSASEWRHGEIAVEPVTWAARFFGPLENFQVQAETPLSLAATATAAGLRALAPPLAELASEGALFELTLAPQSLALESGREGMRLSADRAQVAYTVSAGDLGLAGELTSEGLVLEDGLMSGDFAATVAARRGVFRAPALSLSGAGTVARGTVRGAGDYDIGDWGLHGDWQLERPAGGGLRVASEGSLTQLPGVLDTLDALDLLPADTRLAGGRAQWRVQWSAPVTGSASGELALEMSDVAGLGNSVAFAGLSASGAWAWSDYWRSSEPLRIQVETLSPGIAIDNVSLQLSLRSSSMPPRGLWRLERFEASLLGGRLGLAAPADIRYPPDGNRVVLTLADLQLAEALKLYEQQGVSGHGVLSGEIPLVLTPEGVAVEAGQLASQGPGRIRYRLDGAGEALAGSHEQLKMALRLLEDFQYDKLTVGTHFESDGELSLGLSLTGSNPAEFEGRQINFNINVEENLYDLLQVLRISDEVTASIERQLER